MLTIEEIEAAKSLTGDEQAQAFATISRKLSEDLLYDIRENIPSFDRHYGRACWEHPAGLMVYIRKHENEEGECVGFIAEVRGNLIPVTICQLGFSYLNEEDTALVLDKVFLEK